MTKFSPKKKDHVGVTVRQFLNWYVLYARGRIVMSRLFAMKWIAAYAGLGLLLQVKLEVCANKLVLVVPCLFVCFDECR